MISMLYQKQEQAVRAACKHCCRWFCIIVTGTVALSLLPDECAAQNRMNGPWKMQQVARATDYGSGKNTVLNFYQKWISPVRGEKKCPMYPSCSQYSKNAFQMLPWYMAYIKTMERLLRCGNDLHIYPMVKVDGEVRWKDSVVREEKMDENENADK